MNEEQLKEFKSKLIKKLDDSPATSCLVAHEQTDECHSHYINIKLDGNELSILKDMINTYKNNDRY